MIAVLQRVSKAAVYINSECIGKIGKGFAILVGVTHKDTPDDALRLADKILKLRVFEDESGKMNLSVQDIAGELLLVSQFTLCANLKKGRRPSFTHAALPQKAQEIIEQLRIFLANSGLKVETGSFGAKMLVEILNDGPVTFVIDTQNPVK